MADDFKITVDEEVDPKTGEVVSVKRKTEKVKIGTHQTYMLLRTTNGLGYLRSLKGSKLHILICMSYYAYIWDNTVNTSVAFWDEVSELLRMQKRQIYRLLKEMERDLYVVKLWGGKYMINPDIIIIGGSKYYETNVRRFQKAIKWRLDDKDMKSMKEFNLLDKGDGKENEEETSDNV